MLEVDSLTKRFGSTLAVDGLSFKAEPGRVLGFLGPNGAGKTTTLRTLLGLTIPTSGSATVDGRAYRELDDPVRVLGAVLEGPQFHPGRTGRNHLRVLAAAGQHPEGRVNDVIDQVDLKGGADRRVKGYSMGMRQRLAIAAALLGDPEVLILDEPANGLDPPGIRWMRQLVRAQAERGRAVLISSHLLAEVAQSVDDVVVISHGVLRANGTLESVLGGAEEPVTRVRSADNERLAGILQQQGIAVEVQGPALLVRGASPEVVGADASEHGIAIVELSAVSRSLEDAFFELTGGEE